MIAQRSSWLWCGLAAVSVAVGSQAVAAQETRSDQLEVVKVGLLVPDSGSRAPLGLAARHGAELAVARANRLGGIGGRPIKLIPRSMEGPWGSGSKEVVNLVFEEQVWAVLGALNGRNAHVAEQVVTKGLVALVSPWASDPTLTQVYTPWIFRSVPDDRQQARALAHEIFRARGLRRVATVAEDVYDARVAAAAFNRVAAAAGIPPVLELWYRDPGGDADVILGRLEREGVEGVVLFGTPGPMATLIRAMRARGMWPALFGPLSLADDDLLDSAGPDLEGAVLVAPGHWGTSLGAAFGQEFQAAYGHLPSPVAAYAYDGMRLIIDAIHRAGLDRAGIRDALAAADFRQGVTGRIRFDAQGNRVGSLRLVEILDGRPRPLNGDSSRASEHRDGWFPR